MSSLLAKVKLALAFSEDTGKASLAGGDVEKSEREEKTRRRRLFLLLLFTFVTNVKKSVNGKNQFLILNPFKAFPHANFPGSSRSLTDAPGEGSPSGNPGRTRTTARGANHRSRAIEAPPARSGGKENCSITEATKIRSALNKILSAPAVKSSC